MLNGRETCLSLSGLYFSVPRLEWDERAGDWERIRDDLPIGSD